jgi:uncharacterized membrane protein YfcA
MNIYLPIAEIPVNIFLILSLGMFAGVLAGLFGIGGGFIATPLLIFIGVPPAVAVSTSANQIISSSVSGVLAHLKRNNVDLQLGWFLVIGGFAGSSLGVLIFSILQKKGYIDLTVSVLYILVLGLISILMLAANFKNLFEKKFNIILSRKVSLKFRKLLVKIDNLPLQIYFSKSQIRVSVIVPIFLSAVIGVMVTLMGVGGGFMMIPAMIYILRMPSNLIVGTSLFQIIFIAANATFLQAVTNQTVDITLAFLMIISSVIGAQIGTRLSYKLDADKLRVGLALLIFCVCFKMFCSIFTTPEQVFIVEQIKE